MNRNIDNSLYFTSPSYVPRPYNELCYLNQDHEESKSDSSYDENEEHPSFNTRPHTAECTHPPITCQNNRKRGLKSKKKRDRIQYTEEQVRILWDAFSENKYPGYDVIDQLSRTLRVSESRIKVWFKNARIKCRKGGQIVLQKQQKEESPVNQRIVHEGHNSDEKNHGQSATRMQRRVECTREELILTEGHDSAKFSDDNFDFRSEELMSEVESPTGYKPYCTGNSELSYNNSCNNVDRFYDYTSTTFQFSSSSPASTSMCQLLFNDHEFYKTNMYVSHPSVIPTFNLDADNCVPKCESLSEETSRLLLSSAAILSELGDTMFYFMNTNID